MTLTSQIRDVGTDCGGPLQHHWTPNRPMATTDLGGKVVAAYEVLCGSRYLAGEPIEQRCESCRDAPAPEGNC